MGTVYTIFMSVLFEECVVGSPRLHMIIFSNVSYICPKYYPFTKQIMRPKLCLDEHEARTLYSMGYNQKDLVNSGTYIL